MLYKITRFRKHESKDKCIKRLNRDGYQHEDMQQVGAEKQLRRLSVQRTPDGVRA